MPDLKSELLKVGLVAERQFREVTAAEKLRADMELAKQQKASRDLEKRIEILRESNAPDQFRRKSKKILLQQPSLIDEIIRIARARGMRGKKSGGGRLMHDLLQLRSTLTGAGLPTDALVRFVEKNFSKH
jgi:hypothetical protein